MQLKPITAIIVLLLVSLSIAGCTVSTPSTSSPTPTPTPIPTVVTPMPTVKTSPTAKPTPTPPPDYSSKLNSNPDWLGEGYLLSTPFKKTTVNGREAYVGTLTKMGFAYQVQVFPMSSYSNAVSYREQLINNYKAQGYSTSYGTSTDSWQATSGYKSVDISASETSILGGPLTVTISWSTA